MEPTESDPAVRQRRRRGHTAAPGTTAPWPGRGVRAPHARPTLGEALLRAVRDHGHDLHTAAAALATSRGNVRQWAFDRADPCPEFFAALMAYLELSDDELGGLILRSQLRRSRVVPDHDAAGRLDPARA